MSTLKCWICTLLTAFFCLSFVPKFALANDVDRSKPNEQQTTKQLASKIADAVMVKGAPLAGNERIVHLVSGDHSYWVHVYMRQGEQNLQVHFRKFAGDEELLEIQTFGDDYSQGVVNIYTATIFTKESGVISHFYSTLLGETADQFYALIRKDEVSKRYGEVLRQVANLLQIQ